VWASSDGDLVSNGLSYFLACAANDKKMPKFTLKAGSGEILPIRTQGPTYSKLNPIVSPPDFVDPNSAEYLRESESYRLLRFYATSSHASSQVNARSKE